MSKKPASKPEPAADGAPKPPRTKVKLALMVLAPLLVLGAGGYAGWTFFLAKPAAAEATEAPDTVKVAAIPPEIAAESSFTHSFALSVLIAPHCGGRDVPNLKAASEKEALADGKLVNLSWQAAARRTVTLTEKSCDLLASEVLAAEARATPLPAKEGEDGGEAKQAGAKEAEAH